MCKIFETSLECLAISVWHLEDIFQIRPSPIYRIRSSLPLNRQKRRPREISLNSSEHLIQTPKSYTSFTTNTVLAFRVWCYHYYLMKGKWYYLQSISIKMWKLHAGIFLIADEYRTKILFWMTFRFLKIHNCSFNTI